MNSPTRWLAVLTYAAALARAVPVPLPGDQPRSAAALRQDNPYVLDLRGAWRFDLTHGRMTADGYLPDSFGELASSVQDGHPYEAALDRDPDTRWCASGGELPQWYAVDLGAPTEVTGLDLLWEFDTVRYRFKVDGGDDRKAWRALADLTAEPGAGNGPVKLKPATVRWLRLTIVGVGQGKWASLRELRLTVRRNGKDAAWNPPPPTPPDPRETDRFASNDFDDRDWHDLKVPANWEIEGFSVPTYWGPDNTVGLYRRWIDVPESFAGHRVYWHFDGVNNGAEVWVNGHRAGYHESGMTAWELDISGDLQPGKRNLLALRVCKTTPSHDLDTGDYWFLGGIYRDTWLAAVPPNHVTGVTVGTRLDGAYRDAALELRVEVRGRPGATVGLAGTLYDPAGRPVAGVAPAGEAALDQDGLGTVALSAPVAAPRLWSAEKPDLYTVVLTLRVDGQFTERVEERFGFRQIEIRGGVVLWNGVPIKCTGTCRHEEWPNLGKALDEAAWRRDFELLKGCNINAVRTSHYNFAARFMELADEYGIYVLDEVPFCWANTKDPNLAPAFLLRARETLARDRNHPCVLAWSLGNENEPGPNIQKVVELARVSSPASRRPRSPAAASTTSTTPACSRPSTWRATRRRRARRRCSPNSRTSSTCPAR
ncbi:MAG: discoidin domain-containing protein [Armatimonadetes bacterium]|nr:discoidin domain-containing protein [Armatimonadota bacterium]